MLDLCIQNAKVYDGTGSPWVRVDVGIRGDRIVSLGTIHEPARRRLDARRLAICPGFVDVHVHGQGILRQPDAVNYLRQGVTTIVSGNCGDGAFDVRAFLRRVKQAKPAINFATLIGHSRVRRQVLGTARRAPSRKELKAMRELVAQGMRAGALGLSSGLIYIPGVYAQIPELVALARVAGESGGVYASHTRDDKARVFAAVDEAARIGREASIPVQISHLKTLHRRGKTRKDRMQRVLERIHHHRERGVSITYDVYPYTASATSLAAALIPPWVSSDGKRRERLQNAGVRRRIRGDMQERLRWIGGADHITITKYSRQTALQGQTLAAIARQRRQDALAVAMDLIVGPEASGDLLEHEPSCVFHTMREADVAMAVCDPLGMIASDGAIVIDRKRPVHPRYYGTFPRVLATYVRQGGGLGWPEAIRKMTSAPARIFGLHGRGLIAVGMKADLVLFDPARVADRATYDRPHAYPVGIRAVLVNGQIAWDGRRVARARAGQVVRR